MVFKILIQMISTVVFAALPPEADEYLKQLPGGHLNAEFVVLRGIQKADAFRILGVQWKEAELEKDQALLPLEWNLNGGYTLSDNQFDVTNPFQPTRSQSRDLNLAIDKSFSTGTKVNISWAHGRRNLEFDAIPNDFQNMGSGGFLSDFNQSVASIGFTQDLLKNFLGRATHSELKAAEARVKSQQEAIKDQIGKQAVQLAQAFYSAWGLQEQIKSQNSFIARTKKLLRVVRRKYSNGAIELPEKLQMEAQLSISEGQLEEIQNELVQVWQSLVISLKLPQSFLDVDPNLVPTELDNPVPEALKLCDEVQGLQETIETQAMKLALEALDSQLVALKSQGLPDLKLMGQYMGNGIDPDGIVTAGEVFEGRWPAWQLGLTLNVPLGFRGTRLAQSKVVIEKMKLESRLKVAEQQAQTQWLSRCRRLKLDQANEVRYEKIKGSQAQRVRSQEKRFTYGRAPVNELVGAENDLGSWELRLVQQKAKTRLAAWNILQIQGALFKKYEPILQKALN